MPRAIWNGVVLAESDATRVVEGDHYFPPESVNREYLADSQTTSVCPWKGRATYHHIQVDGDVLTDGAFSYPEPSAAAAEIRGFIAFWKGVKVEQ